jgi:HPt (histidine-containing phosphotransfer) domain-containing protein
MSETSQLDPAAIERLRRLGGDDFARKMLDLFLSFTEQKLTEARQALADGKFAALAKAVHPVQSSAGNVGATRVQALASRIESLATEPQGEPLEALLAELGEAFDEVKVALNEKKHALEAKVS